MVEVAQQLADVADRHARLKAAFEEIYLTELRRCGSVLSEATVLSLLATDLELNAQGMGVWLDRKKG